MPRKLSVLGMRGEVGYQRHGATEREIRVWCSGIWVSVTWQALI